MSSPKYSFAMPAYNAAATIRASIESIQAQTFQNWELIVCNDGSDDETLEIAQECAEEDERIHVISQENAGCGAARDAAVRASHAPWIVRFDADDLLFPNYLAAMDAFITQSPGYDIYSCNGVHLYPDGSRRRARPGRRYEEETSFPFDEMLQATHIFTIAIFSRALYDRIGGISHTAYCEDLDFWLRAMAQGATQRYTPQELAYYTVSATQMSSDFSKIVASRVDIYRSLIDSGTLDQHQVAEAQKAISRVQNDERILAVREHMVGSVERLFGRGVAGAVSKGVHWVGRPIRFLQKRFPGKGR